MDYFDRLVMFSCVFLVTLLICFIVFLEASQRRCEDLGGVQLHGHCLDIDEIRIGEEE